MKIRTVGAETDRHDKGIVAFRNFAKAHEIIGVYELKKNQPLGNKNIVKS